MSCLSAENRDSMCSCNAGSWLNATTFENFSFKNYDLGIFPVYSSSSVIDMSLILILGGKSPLLDSSSSLGCSTTTGNTILTSSDDISSLSNIAKACSYSSSISSGMKYSKVILWRFSKS